MTLFAEQESPLTSDECWDVLTRAALDGLCLRHNTLRSAEEGRPVFTAIRPHAVFDRLADRPTGLHGSSGSTQIINVDQVLQTLCAEATDAYTDENGDTWVLVADPATGEWYKAGLVWSAVYQAFVLCIRPPEPQDIEVPDVWKGRIACSDYSTTHMGDDRAWDSPQFLPMAGGGSFIDNKALNTFDLAAQQHLYRIDRYHLPGAVQVGCWQFTNRSDAPVTFSQAAHEEMQRAIRSVLRWIPQHCCNARSEIDDGQGGYRKETFGEYQERMQCAAEVGYQWDIEVNDPPVNYRAWEFTHGAQNLDDGSTQGRGRCWQSANLTNHSGDIFEGGASDIGVLHKTYCLDLTFEGPGWDGGPSRTTWRVSAFARVVWEQFTQAGDPPVGWQGRGHWRTKGFGVWCRVRSDDEQVLYMEARGQEPPSPAWICMPWKLDSDAVFGFGWFESSSEPANVLCPRTPCNRALIAERDWSGALVLAPEDRTIENALPAQAQGEWFNRVVVTDEFGTQVTIHNPNCSFVIGRAQTNDEYEQGIKSDGLIPINPVEPAPLYGTLSGQTPVVDATGILFPVVLPATLVPRWGMLSGSDEFTDESVHARPVRIVEVRFRNVAARDPSPPQTTTDIIAMMNSRTFYLVFDPRYGGYVGWAIPSQYVDSYDADTRTVSGQLNKAVWLLLTWEGQGYRKQFVGGRQRLDAAAADRVTLRLWRGDNDPNTVNGFCGTSSFRYSAREHFGEYAAWPNTVTGDLGLTISSDGVWSQWWQEEDQFFLPNSQTDGSGEMSVRPIDVACETDFESAAFAHLITPSYTPGAKFMPANLSDFPPPGF